MVHASDIPADLEPTPYSAGGVNSATLNEAVEEAEKATIVAALATCDYHREHSAKLLGVSVRTLHYKMNRYGLH